MTHIKNRILPIIQAEWPVVLLTLIAIILRFYRISYQPVWLDEIYSVQLSRQGFFAIIQNCLKEPHPPFYYILQMLTSGLWNVQSEWGWRWLSVLWGVIAIPAFYLLCRRFTSRLASTLAGMTLAVLPIHIYYSQEARYFIFTILLAIWSTILVVDLFSEPRSIHRWVALTILSVVGLYSNYFFLLIISVQGLVLFFYARQHELWIYAAIITLSTGLAALMIIPTVSAFARHLDNTPSLTLLETIQSLAGEPVRFGVNWQQWLLLIMVSGIALLGIVTPVLKTEKKLISSYFGLQLFLPLIILVILNRAFGIHLLKYMTRELLILTPALLSLFAMGLDYSFKRLGWVIPILLFSSIIVGSIAGLLDYWHMTKSPEGSLVLNIRPQVKPSDYVISLDYSTNAAAYFYLPGTQVLNYLRESNGAYQFTQNLLLSPISSSSSAPVAKINLQDIHNLPHFWVLNRDGIHINVQSYLTDQCTLADTIKVSPFTATFWENCQP